MIFCERCGTAIDETDYFQVKSRRCYDCLGRGSRAIVVPFIVASAAVVFALLLFAVNVRAGDPKGWATWYDDGPGMYGAVPSWRFGDKPYPVDVCRTSGRCVTVVVRDFCACGARHGVPSVIDLSPHAFSDLAPLSTGVIRVTVSRSHVKPPETATFVHPGMTDAKRWGFWLSVLVIYVGVKHVISRFIR